MEITKEVFRELIERSMVNIYQNNLRDFTDTFLRPNWSRRTNSEFSVFIDKVKAEILDDPGFRLYDWMRANGGNTPKVMALIAAAEIEKAPPVDWHQCFIKSDWIKLEYVEKYLTGLILEAKITAINRFIAEVQPAQEEPAQGRKAQKQNKSPEIAPDLLSLEDAFEDATILPKIWGILAAQERPLFDIAGNYIREGEKAKHAALYAFAVATKTRNLLKRNVSPKVFYLILCKHNDIEPTDRPDKITKGKRDYSDYLAAITDHLRDV